MARPKAIEKREKQINIALTQREFDLLTSRANAIGQRVIEFARDAVLKREIASDAIRVASTTDRLAFEQMKRIGANLAEIRGQMQITGQMPSVLLERVLRDIREIINRDLTP